MQTISYTLTYNDVIPTNAKMRYEYGNGESSGDIAFPIITTGSSDQKDHTYTEPGHYSTTLTLFNTVSSVTRTVMVNSEQYCIGENIRIHFIFAPFCPCCQRANLKLGKLHNV